MLKCFRKIPSELSIFGTCFIFYMLIWSGHHYSIDGVVMFQYAKTLLFEHSFVMNPPVKWGVDFRIGQWPIGLTLVYIPVLLILSQTIFSGDASIRQIPYQPGVDYNPALLDNLPYRYSSFVNPMITAVSAVILYRLCIGLGLSKKKSCAVALVFGLASPAAVYAKFDFGQPLASLFLLLTFLFLLKGSKYSMLNLSLAGLFMGIAVLARPELMIPSPILLASVYFIPENEPARNKYLYIKKLKNLSGFTLPLLALVLLNQWINFLKFGSWFRPGYNLSILINLDGKHILIAFLGNLISPGKGVLIFFPLSILTMAGVHKLFELDRWFASLLTFFIAGTFLFYLTWLHWGGGISWGPRFLIPIIPYLCLLAFLAIPDQANSLYPNYVVGTLILLGIIVTLQGVLFNFLDFYGSLQLSSKQFVQGFYNFSPMLSPVFNGWRGLLLPASYDIHWLHLASSTNGKTLFPLLIGLFFFGWVVKVWLDFFRSPMD
jgi:hypothetical protein